jgi:hypothetical protein
MPAPPDAESNGTLGSLTITATQIGPLEVHVDASVTTVGGDGIPYTGSTTGGNHVTLDDQVWLYAQIYDSPWQGGCTGWSSPGPNWCGYGSQYWVNSPTPLNSFALSFTTTVPRADDYQTFVIAGAGVTWNTTGFPWGFVSQSIYLSAVQTLYVDDAGLIFWDGFESGDLSFWSQVPGVETLRRWLRW